jgi:hypothetical protein
VHQDHLITHDVRVRGTVKAIINATFLPAHIFMLKPRQMNFALLW